MMIAVTAANIAQARIVKDTGELLTIGIPDGIIPIHLIIDPPVAVLLAGLLSGYVNKTTRPA